MLVRFNHVATHIVNANHGIVRADEKLTAHRRSEGVKPDTDLS